MYGISFQIFAAFLLDKFGPSAAKAIRGDAGFTPQQYERHIEYPEEDFVDILVVASETLRVPVPDILHQLGRYVLRYFYMHEEPYIRTLMASQGATLRQWISHINSLLDRILPYTLAAAEGENEWIWCTDCDKDETGIIGSERLVHPSILLHYCSENRGAHLVPLVEGIVHELAKLHLDDLTVDLQLLTLQGGPEGATFTTWRIVALDPHESWKLSKRCQSKTQQKMEQEQQTFRAKQGAEVLKQQRKMHAKEIKQYFADKKRAEDEKRRLQRHSQRHQKPMAEADFDEFMRCAPPSAPYLTLRELEALFPFHIVVDQDLEIVQVGNTLPKVLDMTRQFLEGLHLSVVFQSTGTPWNWDSLRQHTIDRKPMVLMAKHHPDISFQGCVVEKSNHELLLVLSLQVRTIQELEQMGLVLEDLPLEKREALLLSERLVEHQDQQAKVESLQHQLEQEQHFSNQLLKDRVPTALIDDLRQGKTTTAQFRSHVTVVASEIDNFSDLCAQAEPTAVWEVLQQMHAVMDYLADYFKLHKVESNGDKYVVAAGLPEEDPEHAEKIANYALAVRACVSHHVQSPLLNGINPLVLRMGMHTGSCIAGVVGTTVPQYCLAGDLTHSTYRYERMGLGGKIHCSSDMFGRLQHMSAYGKHDQYYQFVPRGIVQGQHGETCFTYWLGDATSSNPHVNSTVMKDLLRKVGNLLAKKNWNRPIERSGGFFFRSIGGETASIITMDTVGSTECTELLDHSFKSSFEEDPVMGSDEEKERMPTGSERYFL